MTIFGASKECIDMLFSIFSTNEIEVKTSGETELYDVIIPWSTRFRMQYDSHTRSLCFLSGGREVVISSDHFFRASIV